MPKGDKYLGLTNYLRKCGKNSITLTFTEIEGYSGEELPASAYKYEAYWANDLSHSIAHSWINAGYQTTGINLNKKQIIFKR